MRLKSLSIAYLAALHLTNALAAGPSSPPVNVALRSSWPAPPLLLEIIESAALENTTAFFPLLTTLTDPATFPSPPPTTPEAIHAFALPVIQAQLNPSPGAFASFTASLALHVSTPKIEAFYQYYVENGLGLGKDSGCGSWVDWYGEVVCDAERLGNLIGATSDNMIRSHKKPKSLPFDHIHPLRVGPGVLEHDPEEKVIATHTAILYASLSSPNFRELHTYLLSLSTGPNPKVEYILRYVPPNGSGDGVEKRTYLSGYGVSLDLKKMDYLALDDRHGHGGSSDHHASIGDDDNDKEAPLSDEIDPILSLLQNYPLNESAPDAIVPLTEDELLKIGLHATHLLHTSPSTLKTLQHLSQNFPKYATALARRRVPLGEGLEDEVLVNHAKFGMGAGAGMGTSASASANMMWINGVEVDERAVNPYTLLRLLRKERALVLSLTSLGLSPGEAVDLLTHPALAAASQGQSQQHHQGYNYNPNSKGMVLDGVFDASDRHEGGGVIVWWNDIEADKRYERWNPSIHAILRPLYPGQFPSIRLNIFNVVLAFDLSHSSSLSFIAGTVSSIISRNLPLRFGVVPLLESEQGTKMARLFYYLIENYGRAGTMKFLERISQIQTPVHLLTYAVDWTLVRSEFAELAASQLPRNKDAPTDFDVIVDGTSKEDGDVDSWSSPMDANKIRAYVQRLRLNLASAPHGHAFVNGKHFVMDDTFLRNMQIEVGQQLQYLQEAVYTNQLTEEDQAAASTFFYDLPTTSPRRNQHIYPSSSPGAHQFFNVPQLFSQAGIQAPTAFVYPETKARSDAELEQGAEESRILFTMYVVADLDSEAGLVLVKEALEFAREAPQARISFIHNPSNNTTTQPHMSLLMSHLSQSGSLSKVSPSELMQALGLESAVVNGDGAQTILSQERALRQITGGVDISTGGHEAYVRSSHLLARGFRLKSGDQALVVNGRVVGPIGLGEFVAEDFDALLSYELRRRTGPVLEALVNINPSVEEYDQNIFAHLVSMASSVLSASQVPDPSEAGLFDVPPRPRQRNYRHMGGKYTAFEIGDITTALYQVGVLLDPLSEAAQKWAPLMEWLSTMPDVFIDLHINPSLYTEVPLKRFYRYNIVSSLNFDADGLEHQSQAVFDGLPVDPIYTLGMDVPPAWFVRPREAMYDLDNIQLGALSPEDHIQGMQAIFDLDFLVVEGHARDPRSNGPPRGVQLQLTNGNDTSVDDTQIVATLGYFQFKTKPGVFQLEIREGRGRDIYRLESVGNEGWDSLTVEEAGNEITLTSFEGLTLYPRLTRKPGMEAEDVLAEVEVTTREPPSFFENILSHFSSFLIPNKQTDLIPVAQADINIFTVASGLLYERFVSIMILSVLRNTNSSVKFWFIENFLSPSFLEFIPHLAEAYGFQYELVTYKWPSWLRPQKEKQRIIWAYKILFLDVLFPMDLKKVIFVDADQIVRADLQELVDLDLHGAPYGYTPMGDDNTDMEGFRFWKTGYWKDFLQGRPYHISALYVIDLVKFRQIAAGDILRQQYHGLSADPNSLANLDQDLPNNLQREIPIYSLDEDWLWCETWCSKDRLHRAKTIDLCQNPLTKEPKLVRARAIPEWEEYDSEIARFARKLADEGLIRSNVAAVDVNVLANAGSGATSDAPSEEKIAEQKQPTSDSEAPRGRDEL